jgi:hypothetical protein
VGSGRIRAGASACGDAFIFKAHRALQLRRAHEIDDLLSRMLSREAQKTPKGQTALV